MKNENFRFIVNKSILRCIFILKFDVKVYIYIYILDIKHIYDFSYKIIILRVNYINDVSNFSIFSILLFKLNIFN